MAVMIGALLIAVVIMLSILLICGLPLGELTMGGQYRVFPPKMRILLITQLILQIFSLSLFCKWADICHYGFHIVSRE